MMPLPAPPRPTCPVVPLPDMTPSLPTASVQLQSGMQWPVLTPFQLPLAADGPASLLAGAVLLGLGDAFLVAWGFALSSCPPETDLSCLPTFPPVLPAWANAPLGASNNAIMIKKPMRSDGGLACMFRVPHRSFPSGLRQVTKCSSHEKIRSREDRDNKIRTVNAPSRNESLAPARWRVQVAKSTAPVADREFNLIGRGGSTRRIYRSRARGGSVHATPERVMLDLKTTYAIKRAVATGQAVRMDKDLILN